MFPPPFCPPEANFSFSFHLVEMASCDAETRVTLAVTWQDGVFLLLPLGDDVFAHTPLAKGGRIFLMSGDLNPEIVGAWAARLGKSQKQIERLIRAGIRQPGLLEASCKPARALPNRYPRPNEGPALAVGVVGRVPPKANNYVAYDLGRRRPTKSSAIGRLDELLGTKSSAREKTFHRIIAELVDRGLAPSEERAVFLAADVMAEAKKRRWSWQEALRQVIRREGITLGERRRVRKVLPPLHAFDRIENFKVRKAVRRLHEFASKDALGEWSTSSYKAIYIPRIRKWQTALRKFLRELARSLDPVRPREPQTWGQPKFAAELGMSVSAYRKFLKRSGLARFSSLIQLIHRKRFRAVGLGSGDEETLDSVALHGERGNKHRSRPMRSSEAWGD